MASLTQAEYRGVKADRLWWRCNEAIHNLTHRANSCRYDANYDWLQERTLILIRRQRKLWRVLSDSNIIG